MGTALPGVATPGAYAAFVVAGALGCALLVVWARRRPGPWRRHAARVIALVLLADAASYVVAVAAAGTFSWSSSLPLALCNVAVLVSAAACWWRILILVELTYFWGLAGTLQGVLTPDLGTGFPHLVFFQYVVGHLAVVTAALFLVAGMGIVPRAGAPWRVFLVTIAYSAFVGLVDALSGADYMFLRAPPSNWTALRLLGPWPWYLLTGAVTALVLFWLLDLPLRPARRHAAS